MISFKKTFRQLIHWLHKPAENCEDEREDCDSWAFPEHRLGKHLFITCCITVIHGIYHIYYTAGYIQRYIADFQNFIEVSSRCDIGSSYSMLYNMLYNMSTCSGYITRVKSYDIYYVI